MPYREFSREQDWLLPPSLGDLLGADHPVRFVAEWVDLLELGAVEISERPAEEGAPAYHPKVLLAAWLYGFMVHVRSSRKLERACREDIAFMWLTAMQRPDHVTLWRFYSANRSAMRQVLKQTVRLATEVGLVDFALQAVDGSRVSAAGRESLRERATVEKLLAQVEAEIMALERANQQEQEAGGRPPRGPTGLPEKQALRERLQQALRVLQQRSGQPADQTAAAGAGSAPGATPDPDQPNSSVSGPQLAARGRSAKRWVSLSDPEAVPFKGRQGFGVGYNGQALVDSKAQIVVAAAVVANANDCNQLVPMLDELQAMSGRQPQVLVADTGYFAMSDLIAAELRGVQAIVPDGRQPRPHAPDKHPYHKEHFSYDPATDTYVCPEGRSLYYRYSTQWAGKTARAYFSRNCEGCPAHRSGACTQAKVRSLAIFGHEARLKAHAAKMKTATALALLRRRKAIVEPVFAVFREQIGLQRFLVRGLAKVQAEWRLVCVAHNLRKLYTFWWRQRVLAEATNR